MAQKLREPVIFLVVLLLMVQWALPALMPLNSSVMETVGHNVNWIIVVTLLAAMVFLAFLVVPGLNKKSALLILLGVILDQGIGEAVYQLHLPLFLDTLGSVLVAVLLGPTAGVFCATVSCSLWILIAPVGIPFASASVVTAWIAGLVARLDGFGTWLTMVVSGLTAGLTVAIISSPLTYVLENSSEVRESFGIYTSLAAVDTYFQVLFSAWVLVVDPLDKLVVFSIIFFIAPWGARKFWGIEDLTSAAVRESS